jgi:phenylacetic acid degradation operon negative regulatory protein
MFAFFGGYVMEEGLGYVYSGSIIEVLARAGVGEHAVRSTLSRMVKRGLLQRQRQGRRMYFGLTAQATQLLRNGKKRLWETEAVNDDWDGTWTLLGFSLPESWQRQRHDLRAQLTWSGFGPLFGGLWIAPGEVDVSALVAELGLSAHVKVFRAHADAGMDIGAMIEETWDLGELATRYEAFVRRWQRWETAETEADEALALRLRLSTEWLQVVRQDPRLPVKHLADDWPAEQAEKTFRTVYDRLTPLARESAERLLDLVPRRSA